MKPECDTLNQTEDAAQQPIEMTNGRKVVRTGTLVAEKLRLVVFRISRLL
jgi:hypothetical protein